MTDPAVRRLIDTAEVTDVLYAYCDLVDRAEIDQLAAVFAEDAVFDYGHGRLFTGRDALVALFRDRIGQYQATNHYLSNVRITFPTATTASSVAYVYAFHHYAESGDHFHVWGRYIDDLVRTADGWRIQTRKVRTAGDHLVPVAPGTTSRFERYDRAPL